VPTYQYTCTECGEPVEAVQKFSDPPLTVCENCGGRLRKVFSPVGIVFKGSGFYRTDSRNGSSKDKPATTTSSDGKPSSDKPSSDKAADKKTDTASTSNASTSSSTSSKSSSEKVA